MCYSVLNLSHTPDFKPHKAAESDSHPTALLTPCGKHQKSALRTASDRIWSLFVGLGVVLYFNTNADWVVQRFGTTGAKSNPISNKDYVPPACDLLRGNKKKDCRVL